MDTQRYLISLVFLSFSLSGCLFGENKQFFETPAGTAIAGITNGSPDPSATPIVSATPDPLVTPTATPVPTSTPIIIIPTPTPSPTATPSPTCTPHPTATPVPSATPVPTATPSPSATPVCTVSTTTKNLRIMFMIDNSGSTATTDPHNGYRVKTIQDFLASYSSHTNLTYSFGYFSWSTSPEYDMVQNKFLGSTSNIFGDASGLSNALTKFNSLSASGWTPYSAAFTALKNEVTADERAGTKQDYVVVFMSDGQPTDINGNVASGIISMVDQLRLQVQSNGTSLLTVSSVYFGPADDHVSIGNLQTMASEGQGQFVDTNASTSLSIHDLITVPSCH